MKQLRKELQSVVKTLKSQTQKIDRIAKKLDRLDRATATKRPKMKTKARPLKKVVAKKTTRVSPTDTVLSIIKRSKKGVDTAALRTKTGFNEIKIRNVIYRLKKQGTIKSARRGIYVKA